MTSTLITLVRHGKVAGPAALYGRTDIALSAAGYADVTRTLQNVHAHSPVSQVISSPRQRCLTVAQEFSAQHRIALQIEENLREMDFGVWDGVPFDALGNEWKNIEAFWDSPEGVQPPQGEALNDFAARIISSWATLIGNAKSAHHLVICHGGVIRILIAHILKLDWQNPALFKQLQIDYASHTRIEIGDYDYAVPVIQWIGNRV